ncbi:MAG: hypothetical protein U5K75_10195 [Ahrensia sp.]|nr:hypothetical protein [Ahrensia sp.]
MTAKNAKKCVGWSVLGLVAGAALFSPQAFAQPQFDRTIERATANIVAKKLGELRGGVGFQDDLILVDASLFEQVVVTDDFTTNGVQVAQTFDGRDAYARHDKPIRKTVRVVYTGTIIEN